MVLGSERSCVPGVCVHVAGGVGWDQGRGYSPSYSLKIFDHSHHVVFPPLHLCQVSLEFFPSKGVYNTPYSIYVVNMVNQKIVLHKITVCLSYFT